MGYLKRCSLVVLPLALGALSVHAETLNYANWDTRNGGSFTVDTTNTPDGTGGSLKLETHDAPPVNGQSQDKVAVIFYSPNGALGTLGQLTGLTLDAYKSATPTTSAPSDFAYRLQLDNGHSLVYENTSNGSDTVDLGVWRPLDLIDGKFWLYDGANHNAAGEEHPLAFYSSESGHSIVGLQVAYGSGIGAFSGNVDNIHLDFSTGASFDGPVTTPLPSTALGGMACFGLLGAGVLVRRRRSIA